MLFGGPVFLSQPTPETWARKALSMEYRAVTFPVDHRAGDRTIDEYHLAADRNGLVIAEVGAWSNPISTNESARKDAIDYCVNQLRLADRVRAKCCVNIAGSLGEKWDGPHEKNLTEETFQRIVKVVQEIIDRAEPVHTYYTLEPMPWMYPNTAESYSRLIQAVDRERFAVHIDPVNVIYSPDAYFQTGKLIREWFERLGPYIKSCHAKDVKLQDHLTLHIDECLPGTGNLDFFAYYECLSKLDKDIPLLIEHLHTQEECDQAAEAMKRMAKEYGFSFGG